MFIVGIFVPFLSMVAAILVYVATDSQLKKELSIPWILCEMERLAAISDSVISRYWMNFDSGWVLALK